MRFRRWSTLASTTKPTLKPMSAVHVSARGTAVLPSKLRSNPATTQVIDTTFKFLQVS